MRRAASRGSHCSGNNDDSAGASSRGTGSGFRRAAGAIPIRWRHQRIAVLVPCYNEEAAIAKVVADFRAALPDRGHLRLRQQFARPHRRDRPRRRRRSCAARPCRARVGWCAACSPRSRPTSTSWSTATRPMTRRARGPWRCGSCHGPPRHGGRRPHRPGHRPPTGAATASATASSPPSSPTCSARPSPTSCRAIGRFRAAS